MEKWAGNCTSPLPELGMGERETMGSVKLKCNKTTMYRLTGEVLKEKMLPEYQKFKEIRMRDMEYWHSKRFGGRYELKFYLGDELTECILNICWGKLCFFI